ncbi:hypothetical protein D3C74_376120 [compost metagenome]
MIRAIHNECHTFRNCTELANNQAITNKVIMMLYPVIELLWWIGVIAIIRIITDVHVGTWRQVLNVTYGADILIGEKFCFIRSHIAVPPFPYCNRYYILNGRSEVWSSVDTSDKIAAEALICSTDLSCS